MNTSVSALPIGQMTPHLALAIPRVLQTARDNPPASHQKPSAARVGLATAVPIKRERRLTLAVALAAALGSGMACHHALTDPVDPADHALAALAFEQAPLDTQAVFLVRSTLMALNDANRSGNYSVLRDLAGPRFQARNSVTQLGDTFRPFRETNLDLSHAGMVVPQLTQVAPSGIVSAQGILQIDGHIPAQRPGQTPDIRFAMEFEAGRGHWQLLTLSVGTTPLAAMDRPKQ